MNRYIILGIGIGVILTNFFYSVMPNNKVDINKMVEIEVQKRIKKIEEMRQVEETFKNVVEKEEVNKKGTKEYFSKDDSPNAIYYIYIGASLKKEELIKEKTKLENFLETRIDLTEKYAYLLSEYPYSVENTEIILKELKNKYGIEAKKLKISEFNQLKTEKNNSLNSKIEVKEEKKKVDTKSGKVLSKEIVKEEVKVKEEAKIKVEEAVKVKTESDVPKTVEVKSQEIIKEVELPKE